MQQKEKRKWNPNSPRGLLSAVCSSSLNALYLSPDSTTETETHYSEEPRDHSQRSMADRAEQTYLTRGTAPDTFKKKTCHLKDLYNLIKSYSHRFINWQTVFTSKWSRVFRGLVSRNSFKHRVFICGGFSSRKWYQQRWGTVRKEEMYFIHQTEESSLSTTWR